MAKNALKFYSRTQFSQYDAAIILSAIIHTRKVTYNNAIMHTRKVTYNKKRLSRKDS